MMKLRNLIILLSIISTVSCTSSKDYSIDGIYTAENGAEVYLIDLDRNDTLGITSVEAGKFAFNGRLFEPAYVYVGRGRERVRFILEAGTTKVDLDERTEGGTPMTEACNAYDKLFYGYSNMRNESRKLLSAQKDEMTPESFSAAWDSLNNLCTQQRIRLADSMVRSNKDNLVAAYVMADLASVDPETFINLREVLSEPVRNHSLVSEPYSLVMASAETAPGKPFTDYLITGGNPDGTDVRLSDYVGRGKYILLDHWASWCGPCKREMPYIKKAYEDFHGEKFDVVSIAVSDAREDTMEALTKLDMPWNQILDAGSIPGDIYGIKAIPHIILFAPDGTILRRDLRGDQIYSVLEEILK